MFDNQSRILTQTQIRQKVKRIAFEMYEHNFEESSLVLVGIEGMGYVFADMLCQSLKAISSIDLQLVKLSLNKSMPTQSDVRLSVDDIETCFANKTVVLIDDVLNTGRTFAYSLKPFLNVRIKKLQTAVLINRSHHLFPISADFVGYELSTTIKEHIQVVLNDDTHMGVYLN